MSDENICRIYIYIIVFAKESEMKEKLDGTFGGSLIGYIELKMNEINSEYMLK